MRKGQMWRSLGCVACSSAGEGGRWPPEQSSDLDRHHELSLKFPVRHAALLCAALTAPCHPLLLLQALGFSCKSPSLTITKGCGWLLCKRCTLAGIFLRYVLQLVHGFSSYKKMRPVTQKNTHTHKHTLLIQACRGRVLQARRGLQGHGQLLRTCMCENS